MRRAATAALLAVLGLAPLPALAQAEGTRADAVQQSAAPAPDATRAAPAANSEAVRAAKPDAVRAAPPANSVSESAASKSDAVRAATPAANSGAVRDAKPDAVREAPAAKPDAVREPPRAPGLRASHRVDVIGPGERVETVIDRMRANRAVPVPPADARPPDRPSVRPPEKGPRGPDHPDSPHGEHGPPASRGSSPSPHPPR